MKCDFIFRVSF